MSHRHHRARLGIVTAAVATALTLACGIDNDPGEGEHPSSASSAAPPSATPEQISANPQARVPGGAPARVAPGSPPICTKIAAAAALAEMNGALDSLAAHGPSTQTSTTLHRAGDDLRTLAADDVGLARDLRSAGDALDDLSTNGLTDTAVERFAIAFTILGQEVQQRCHFPVSDRSSR